MLTRKEIQIGMLVRVDSTPIKETDPRMTHASCVKGQITLIHPELGITVVTGKWLSQNHWLEKQQQFVAFTDLINYTDCISCNSNFKDTQDSIARGMLLSSGLWLCMPCVEKTCNERYPGVES